MNRDIKSKFKHLSEPEILKTVFEQVLLGHHDRMLRDKDMRRQCVKCRKLKWSTEQIIKALQKDNPHLSKTYIKRIITSKGE